MILVYEDTYLRCDDALSRRWCVRAGQKARAAMTSTSRTEQAAVLKVAQLMNQLRSNWEEETLVRLY